MWEYFAREIYLTFSFCFQFNTQNEVIKIHQHDHHEQHDQHVLQHLHAVCRQYLGQKHLRDQQDHHEQHDQHVLQHLHAVGLQYLGQQHLRDQQDHHEQHDQHEQQQQQHLHAVCLRLRQLVARIDGPDNLFYTIFMFRVVRRALERSSQLRNKYTVGNFQIWLTFLLIKALLAYTYETMLNKINFPFIRVFFPQICQVAFVKKKFFLKKI